MAALVFHHDHRVTYAECTLGNHVYYSRYLNLLETARGEFFRELGMPLLQLQENGTIFPVIECHLRYKFPARYDDVLTIQVWVTGVTGVRLNFGHRIVNKEQALILEAETLHVCAGLNEKPKRIPEQLVEKLRPYLQPPELSAT